MRSMLEYVGCSYPIALALPHSLTAVPLASFSENGGSLSYREFHALKTINRIGQYRALVVAGVGFIMERAGMVSSGDKNTMLLAVGLLAFDALITSVYKLRAEKRFYNRIL